MAQSRNDYWWNFIQNNEKLYNLCYRDLDQSVDGNIYEDINRILDYIYGYNTSDYTSGIVYGLKIVPYAQNILISSDSNLSQSSTKDLNYNIICVNKEYSSFPNGQPILVKGALSVSDKLYSVKESSLPIKIFNPPQNLKNVILTSSVYLNIDTFNNYLSLNNTIENSINLSIVELFQEYDGNYILENNEYSFTLNSDYSKYDRNIYNNNYFPQLDSNNIIDICKIVYRINDTTDSENMKYEYYLIDSREINGFFGFKQIDILGILLNLSNNIKFTQINSVDLIKSIFSYLFNEMSGTGGEFSPDFITYWNSYLSPDSVSQTIQDLYDELGP